MSNLLLFFLLLTWSRMGHTVRWHRDSSLKDEEIYLKKMKGKMEVD